MELWKAQKTLWEINEDGNRTLFGQNEVLSLGTEGWGPSLGILTFSQASLLEKSGQFQKGPCPSDQWPRAARAGHRSSLVLGPCTELLGSILPSPMPAEVQGDACTPSISLASECCESPVGLVQSPVLSASQRQDRVLPHFHSGLR